jgi:pilus assembly protein CpaE
VALQLALAAVRAAPGKPVCVVDFDLQKGDFRSFLDMPHRRSVVDLVEVADEISVRHLQETLYTHKEGFRVLLAPDDGERAEEVSALVARSILNAVKARHALTIVDLGASVSEASAIGAEIANRTLVVTQPDVVSLRGVKRLLELWKRLQVREDDEDVLVVLNRASRKLEVQPDLARKVIAGRLARTTIPADFSSFEAAVNTGTPARMEDAKLRASFDALLNEADALPAAGEEPEGDPACSATPTCWRATRRARGRASWPSTRRTPRRRSPSRTPPRKTSRRRGSRTPRSRSTRTTRSRSTSS